MHRPSLRLAAALLAVAALAGCGGSPAPQKPQAPPPPKPTLALEPCVAGARAAVSRAAGDARVRTRTTGASATEATCVYDARRMRVEVFVDGNPQAAVRFERAVVERDQVAVWSGDHTHAPRLLTGIGQGADWFPADREVLATDARLLVSVKLVRSPPPGRSALRLARVVAAATLRQVP